LLRNGDEKPTAVRCASSKSPRSKETIMLHRLDAEPRFFAYVLTSTGDVAGNQRTRLLLQALLGVKWPVNNSSTCRASRVVFTRFSMLTNAVADQAAVTVTAEITVVSIISSCMSSGGAQSDSDDMRRQRRQPQYVNFLGEI